MSTELPSIPTTWNWGRLGDILTAIEAGKSFKCEERPPRDAEVGVVKVSAVTWGTFDENESKTCLEPARITPHLFINQGDFLFSRANTIQLVGACVIVRSISRRIMLSDKILRFKVCDALPEWLLYVLRTPWGRSEIESLASGNQESMRNIGQERIRSIRIPLPPIDQQRILVDEIEKQFTRVDAATQVLDRAQRRIVRFRQAVLSQAISGNLLASESIASIGVTLPEKQSHPNPAISPELRGGRRS
jgi:type I restriction enzyme S subunit